jgi:hypothetical protein
MHTAGDITMGLCSPGACKQCNMLLKDAQPSDQTVSMSSNGWLLLWHSQLNVEISWLPRVRHAHLTVM